MPNPDQLQQSVLAALRWEPGVSAAQIGVAAYAGVITLTGVVESYAEKHAAEVAARWRERCSGGGSGNRGSSSV